VNRLITKAYIAPEQTRAKTEAVRHAPFILFISDRVATRFDHGGRTYAHAILTHLAARGCTIDYFCLDPVVPAGAIFARIPRGAAYLRQFWSPHHVRLGRLLAQRSAMGAFRWHAGQLREALYRFDSRHRLGIKRLYRAFAARGNSVPAPQSEPTLWTLPAGHREVLDAALRSTKPDAVIVDYTRFASLFDHVPPGVHKLLVTHDIVHHRAASYGGFGLKPDFENFGSAAETALLRKADTIIAIHQPDARILKEMAPDRRVICVPMPVTGAPVPGKLSTTGRCMFVGGSSAANAEGISWFLDEVWPRVLTLAPQASLNIYGNVCKKLAGPFPRTRFVGPVSNISRAYAEAAVCVVPLRVGSGLKIKVVEAAAHGRAVVATRAALSGLDSLVHEAVPVSDQPEEFAQWTARLLLDDVLRESYAQKLTNWAATNLSPAAAFAELDAVLQI
jgi:glycosyltransferase involved in cell wall biosynthesis